MQYKQTLTFTGNSFENPLTLKNCFSVNPTAAPTVMESSIWYLNLSMYGAMWVT